MKRQGYTLIKMLTVVAIIAILITGLLSYAASHRAPHTMTTITVQRMAWDAGSECGTVWIATGGYYYLDDVVDGPSAASLYSKLAEGGTYHVETSNGTRPRIWRVVAQLNPPPVGAPMVPDQVKWLREHSMIGAWQPVIRMSDVREPLELQQHNDAEGFAKLSIEVGLDRCNLPKLEIVTDA